MTAVPKTFQPGGERTISDPHTSAAVGQMTAAPVAGAHLRSIARDKARPQAKQLAGRGISTLLHNAGQHLHKYRRMLQPVEPNASSSSTQPASDAGAGEHLDNNNAKLMEITSFMEAGHKTLNDRLTEEFHPEETAESDEGGHPVEAGRASTPAGRK